MEPSLEVYVVLESVYEGVACYSMPSDEQSPPTLYLPLADHERLGEPQALYVRAGVNRSGDRDNSLFIDSEAELRQVLRSELMNHRFRVLSEEGLEVVEADLEC